MVLPEYRVDHNLEDSERTPADKPETTYSLKQLPLTNVKPGDIVNTIQHNPLKGNGSLNIIEFCSTRGAVYVENNIPYVQCSGCAQQWF